MKHLKTPMSDKSDAMRDTLEAMWPGTKKRIAEGKCPVCSRAITAFRDHLSEREFEVSGLCQKCQDSIWEDEQEQQHESRETNRAGH